MARPRIAGWAAGCALMLAGAAAQAAGAGPDPDEQITLAEVLANVDAASAGLAPLLDAMLLDAVQRG